MKEKTIRKLGDLLVLLGVMSMWFGISTDEARDQARSRKEVSVAEAREMFKEDCKPEKTTKTMKWAGALVALSVIGMRGRQR